MSKRDSKDVTLAEFVPREDIRHIRKEQNNQTRGEAIIITFNEFSTFLDIDNFLVEKRVAHDSALFNFVV